MNGARDRDWSELVSAAKAAGKRALCADLAATDPLYILYTSGTTGVPKGVVRDIGGYLVALKWSMSAIYDVKPGETFWTGSDIGWVVGHSYIVYGPLLHGCASVLYEGKPVGTPDAGAFWRVIQDYKVAAFFTAPTALRAVRKEDPQAKLLEKYDISSLRTLFLAGERADPDTVAWAQKALGVPVVDHWWQTETGWPIAANPVGLGILPIKLGSPTVPMPGYDVEVVDEAARPLPAGTMGSIVIKLPLPPGCLPTLYRQDERMRESYLTEFPGYYKTADAGFIDEDGYLTILGRTDDIINVAGHRLSTGGMEEVVASHPDVAECAVLGIKDEIKGEQPCGFLVLEGRRQPAARGDREGGGQAGARQDRPGGGVQDGDRRAAPAEDPLGQDPARHDQEDRRPGPLGDPGDDRGPEGAGRDRRRARGAGAVGGLPGWGLKPGLARKRNARQRRLFTIVLQFALGLLDPALDRSEQRALGETAAPSAMCRLGPGDDRDCGRPVGRPDRRAGIAAAGAGLPSAGIGGPDQDGGSGLADGEGHAAQGPARRPVALTRRAIAGDDRRRADRRRFAFADRRSDKARVERPRGADQREVDRFDAGLNGVGAVARVSDRRVDRNDDRRPRGVAIMDRQIREAAADNGRR